MTDTARFKVIPPEQAVIELGERLNALERRHRDALILIEAGKREVAARKAFDMAGNQKAFDFLTESRDAFVLLVDAWPL